MVFPSCQYIFPVFICFRLVLREAQVVQLGHQRGRADRHGALAGFGGAEGGQGRQDAPGTVLQVQ